MSASVAHVYRYAGASTLVGDNTRELTLVTSGQPDEAPCFFRGKILRPRATAMMLRGVSRIVGTRFYTPPAMLTRILLEADPVVTCGGGILRFEGFSACASAYARVDLSSDAYAGEVLSCGTTNVDFNAPMRAALSGVTDADGLAFTVGRDRVEVERAGATVIERKVQLPLRWLKGFLEVQAYQAAMALRFTLPGPEALRFLRGLPRASTSRQPQWVHSAGNTIRLGMRETKDGVRLAGAERLRILEDLAPLAQTLRIYADDAGQATAWELTLGPSRFTLVLSAEVFRGFSGEGQALTALSSHAEVEALVARARAWLSWQACLRPAALATSLGVDQEPMRKALLVLGARGLVGFDVGQGAFFHRELPFDLSLVEQLQPRLLAARALLAKGGIVPGEGGDVFVPGTGVVHRVRLIPEGARCTCPWFAKHQGDRGPCKHILAAQMFNGDPA